MRFSTVLLYSGWNCTPTNHLWQGLDDFGQSAFRVDTGGDHTPAFQNPPPVFAVELIPVSLLYFFFVVSFT